MNSIEKKVKKYLKARKWEKNEPVNISKSIIIEGAELMELFQWDNPKRAEILKNNELKTKIKGELADIFIYSLNMTISLGFSVEKIIEEKLRQVEKKYPIKEIKKGQSQYLKLKQEHRRKNA